MEQESSNLVEELTDVQAFDQSPGGDMIKQVSSPKLVMIS